jgi:hypothetical protein
LLVSGCWFLVAGFWLLVSGWAIGTMNEKRDYASSSDFLCFGFFRKFFGIIILGDGTLPTRSRARARISFFALYFLGLRNPFYPTNRLRYIIEFLAGCPSSD